MQNRLGRQEKYKIKKKLVLENIRRVFFACLACLVVLPIMILINNKTNTTAFASITNGVLKSFFVFSGVSLVISYISLKNRDINLSTLVYRTFWLIFEIFGLVVTYSDKVSGSGFSFYGVMVAALFLTSAMSLSEQMYYMVILAVYSVFLSIKFKLGVGEIFNMVLIAGTAFTISRILYGRLVERLTLKERERESKDSAAIDGLTGLLNRKGFEKRTYYEMKECISSHRRASILMIDIDDMAKYNDSYGPERGDECIKSVAEYIKQVVLRNSDTICRLNGGRFLVFMSGGNEMEPVTLAEKVRSNIERKRIPHGRRAANSFVTVSIGVASCVPRAEEHFSEMYDEAEDSLFDAKEHGKNITVYEEQIYGAYNNRRAAY